VSTLRLDAKGTGLLAACSDRVIRLFEATPPASTPPAAGDGSCQEGTTGYSVEEAWAIIAALPSVRTPKAGFLR